MFHIKRHSRISPSKLLFFDMKTFLFAEVTKYEDIRKLGEESFTEHRKRSKARMLINEAKPTFVNNNNKSDDVGTRNSRDTSKSAVFFDMSTNRMGEETQHERLQRVYMFSA